jgi:hypothetical protein
MYSFTKYLYLSYIPENLAFKTKRNLLLRIQLLKRNEIISDAKIQKKVAFEQCFTQIILNSQGFAVSLHLAMGSITCHIAKT